MDAIQNMERNLLGSILLDNRHFDETAQHLSAKDYSLDSHRMIWRRLADLRTQGRQVDPWILGQELDKHGELTSVGGFTFLSSLPDGMPRRAAVTEWVVEIAKASRWRSIRAALGNACQEIDTGGDADIVNGQSVTRLLELQPPTKVDNAVEMLDLLNRMQRERTRKTDLLGLPTGLKTLDAATSGLLPSEVILIGAWTSVGKSALMLQAAVANARAGTPVLIFSLEMTRDQLRRRMISMISGVPCPRVRDTKWATDADMAAIQYAASQIADWPLEIDHNSGIHVDQIAAKARHAIRKDGVKLVCVDYVQIVSADGKDVRIQVTNASRALTRIAKDEGVPLIMLSQLTRVDKSNAERRPRLSDLRESSQLENDGNLIILLHRPRDEESGVMGASAEIVVAKQRDGSTGTYPVSFSQTSVTFEECKSASSAREKESA
jgi:replicative DNA helicase